MKTCRKVPNSSLDRLKWSLQALALPAEQQADQFPSFVWVGDELATDFDFWYRRALERNQFTFDQMAALAAVDKILEKMTAENNMYFWEDSAALSRYKQWQEVRDCARRALQVFGWELQAPPKNRAIYVGPRNE